VDHFSIVWLVRPHEHLRQPIRRVDKKEPVSAAGDDVCRRRDVRPVQETGLDRNPEGDVQPFHRVKSLLKADIVVANLETALLRAPPKICPWPPNLRFAAGAWAADALAEAGFTVMSLANNHAYDMKGMGLKETRELLRERRITPVGVSGEDDFPIKITSREIKGWRVAFIGFTSLRNSVDLPGVPPMPYIPDFKKVPPALQPAIERARADHHLVIVLAHWGETEYEAPTQPRIDASRQLIDLGADLVIGHHPHVLQGVEQYKDGIIAHSLGDFLFDKLRSPSRLGGVLRLRFEPGMRRPAEVLFHPVVIAREKTSIRPEPAGGKAAVPVVERIQRLSGRFRTSWVKIGNDLSLLLASMPPVQASR
jgi:poly-gamma-glutamate capsule biosynthesis protein CapA/YwtB (metallophosphatase superfamily)